jgi:hypothetical protein
MATPLDLAPLQGDWVSATGLSGGISRVRTYRSGEALMVHAHGGCGPKPGDWGEVKADGVFANALRSNTGHAFCATFDNGKVSSHLQTYQGLGVVVVHAFHRFNDNSGRRDYFTREFYVAAAQHDDGQPRGTVGDGLPSALLAGHNDPSELLGSWSILDTANPNILTLDCVRVGGNRVQVDEGFVRVGGDLAVRARGMENGELVDWGVTDAQLYADAANPYSPPAFLATFDHGDRRVHLQARVNRGVLVVGEYTEFTDNSERSNYFIRECYYPSV